ncbi:MAG TPA: carboxypeptidase regulatory-like domain-containing protein [Candidatus Polarisedimenticolia bacterium]|nr:carboxypeptidase regulatory-like domain-containing protein [Candidatus Polarisedimenticolia bacterium]
MLGALLVLLPIPIQAQTTGAIRGVVTDPTGLPLEGVTLLVSSAAQAVSGRAGVSDSEGRFQIGSLPSSDDYAVAVSLAGFASVTLTDVVVVVGQGTLLQVTLMKDAAALSEKVEVRAQAPIISLQETTTQSRFTAEFIESLPLLGRNYQDLLVMAPGVSDVDGDGNPNIHGARDTDVVTLVDGVSTTDPLTGQIGAQLNIESIQEIEVKTSGATAEFSRAQGGFANIITKSGGNQFEGTFKIFWRGSALDGDGAGIDDPNLHAGVGESGLRDLTFNDVLPFLSLSGPIAKDRAWFYLASEYVQIQDPVNALTTAFVAEQREFRQFAKLTWQAAPSHRLALSLNYDPQQFLNQGLNTFTREESGYTLEQGGPILTARWVGVLGPNASLETSLSHFEERPVVTATLDPDVNGNGILFVDKNTNGFGELSEYDPGEDYDADGAFDVFEDFILPRGQFDPQLEDVDHDGRQTPPKACEGFTREDADCDGHLDYRAEDLDGDGVIDPGEDIDNDGRLDPGTEDRNGNLHLDDTPHPDGPYPYGRTSPLPQDRFYALDQQTNIVSGPYYRDLEDSRRRFTFRQDLTFFVPDFYGSHDLKGGIVVEKENFDRTTDQRPFTAPFVPRTAASGRLSDPPTVRAIMPVESRVENEASNITGGIYIQDSYKPFPNLSIGLGLRFDREATDSFGYSFFEPADERAKFDRLHVIIGGELPVTDDHLYGNDDGIHSLGIRGDPLFSDPNTKEAKLAVYIDPARVAAYSRLTRHHSETGFISQQLESLFPEIAAGGEVTADILQGLGVVPQQQEPFRITNNNLAPRLSIAWDPLSDGRTKLFATWGRYYDKLFLSTIVGEEGPDTINRYYLFDRDGVVGPQSTPNHQIGPNFSKAPPSITQVDRGLQTPFSDEFTLGFERELAPETAISILFVDREYRQQLQDVDVNHTLRYDRDTGRPTDALGLLPGTAGSGTSTLDRRGDFRPDLYIYNFFFNQVLRVGNYNQARYRGVELELTRRLARRWEMQASYTYSRATGDAEAYDQRLGNDPSTVESEPGYLDYDERHVVKVNTSLYLPRDWQLGVSAAWGSGLPYSVISRFFALDNVDYQQFRTMYGSTQLVDDESTSIAGDKKVDFVPEQRNSRRNHGTFTLGGRARKSFVLGRNTAGVFLEVFDILNTDDLRIESYEPVPLQRSVTGPLQINGTRQFGRRFQLGFQIDF